MPREAFFPNPRNKPQGFSPATRVGNFVFVSGQVSVDVCGDLVGQGDCGAQSEQVFRNVEAALRAAGATLDDIRVELLQVAP
jgi:enamine deaminase RidA (YjgF/YER057c/UK114 family)